MKYKITAKDEIKKHLTVAFLKADDSVFKTVVMDARFLPVEDALALDEELSKQARAMELEAMTEPVVFSKDIKINEVVDAKEELVKARMNLKAELVSEEIKAVIKG